MKKNRKFLLRHRFTIKEIDELRKLFDNNEFNKFSYKLFYVLKTNSKDKYAIIDDNLYYEKLSPLLVEVLEKGAEKLHIENSVNDYNFMAFILLFFKKTALIIENLNP